MNHVLLIGFMGAGKSTVGPRLAVQLGVPFIDLDDRIVAEQGLQIARIFSDQGEARFREIEHDALASLSGEGRSVVACGGGIVTLPESRALLRGLGTVVYLRTTAAEALARIRDTSSRPLLDGPHAQRNAADLLSTRSALYAETADIEIDTVGQTPVFLAEQIAGLVSEREAAR
jgi:shikimate kinase